MKKLKLVFISVMIAVMTFSFVACSSSPVVGEWKLVAIEVDDTVYTVDEWWSMMDPVHYEYMERTLTVNKDGTCKITTNYNSTITTSIYLWKFEDNILYLADSEEDLDSGIAWLKYNYENDKLFEDVGSVFEKTK